MLSQVFGNIIAAFLIKLFSQTTFFIVMSSLAFLGVLLFLILKEPEGPFARKLFETFDLPNLRAPMNSVPIPLTLELEDPLLDFDETDEPNTARPVLIMYTPNQIGSGSFKSTIELFMTTKMLKIVSLMVSSGLILAFYSGFLVKLISNTVPEIELKLTKALY